jgi:hypothetical protein
MDFFEAAQLRFLAADAQRAGEAVSMFAALRRGEAPEALAASVLAATPGAVVGPVPVEDGFVVVRVLDVTPARLDEPVRAAIARLLFDEWLEERRRSARIEWNWGNAALVSGEGPAAA